LADTNQVLFRREYEHELDAWLRGRFGLLCIAYLGLGGLRLLIHGASLYGMMRLDVAAPRLVGGAVYVVGSMLALATIAIFYVRRLGFTRRDDALRAATWMILVLGAMTLAERFIVESLGVEFSSAIILSIFFWHLTACLFLPWTARESMQPILPLMLVWAIGVTMDARLPAVERLVQIMFSPAILLPGLLICAWRLRRHSDRFRNIMLWRHFRSLRQEFSRARSLHESLFPKEYDDGYVRLQYTYEPMRELGGDYLHVHVTPQGLVHVTVIDVTGHGLTAALTVNRISGELDRIRGESPRASPGEVLTLLNRYIALTMASHNMYATAIAMCIDPFEGEVRWASGGHPPALLRGINGVVRRLESTAMMLGALDDDRDFEAAERTAELSPGDVIVA